MYRSRARMATRKSRFRLTALGVVPGAGVVYAVGGLTRRARGGALERSLRAQEAGLRRVRTLAARGAPAEAVLDEVAGQVAALLGADAAAVQRYDPDAHATVVGNWGALGRMFPVGSRLKLEGGSITASVYRTEQPARFDDYEHAAGAAATGARQVGLRSAVGSPVFVAGRLWGAIVAGTSRPEPLPADTEHRIAQFTPMVATAISNFEARTEVQRLADEQAALRGVATLVARQRPPDEIFAQVAQDVGVLLGAETAVIHRYEADGDATVVGSWGVLGDAFQVGRRATLEGDNVTASVHRAGRSARLDDYGEATGSIAAAARTFGARSAVGAPVVVNEGLWGVIGAATSRAELMPADAERRLAQFAELVAMTISNVQARTETQRLTDGQARLRRGGVL